MIAEVVLPLPLDKTFYYTIGEGMRLDVGDYVKVPFGHRELVGVVIDIKDSIDETLDLKCVGSRVALPAMSPALIKFMQWVGTYNVVPIGTVLKMVFCGMPAGKFLLCDYESVQEDVVRGDNTASSRTVELSEDQNVALKRIIEHANGFYTIVLDGETGSGKTEVYCAAIRKFLHDNVGAQVLILLPEIVLATQLMKRVHTSFGGWNPIAWHSGLSVKKRRENWLSVATGSTSVIVGARSALFLPFKNLKMIVVDEEHESSYKQDGGVIYNARDMAVVLAKQVNIPVVLCSATPSLETILNVRQGKYINVVLRGRFGEAVMPDIAVVDMKRDKLLKSWLSTRLHSEMADTLAKKQQVLLFLNRRGYSRLVLCKECGHKINCPNCSTWLVEHKTLDALLCHYCAYSSRVPKECAHCMSHGTMIPYGAGVEKVAEVIAELFPEARIAIMSSDISTKDATSLVDKIIAGEIDIIVGTQILAKGHNFPYLTLVGVLDADLGLSNSDLRAAEKTYQLLHQVSGRSGRFQERGKVILQTHDPENVVIRALLSYKREDFYDVELKARKLGGMPPYMRLVALIASGRDELNVIGVARDIAASASKSFTVWGPAPAPMSFVNNMYRYRILLKVENISAVRGLLCECREKYKKARHVRVAIDVDPVNFI